MKKEWVISLREQCRRARVPFFFKQWGGVRKSVAGRELDGMTYDELPERVSSPVMDAEESFALADQIESIFKGTDLISISSLTLRACTAAV